MFKQLLSYQISLFFAFCYFDPTFLPLLKATRSEVFDGSILFIFIPFSCRLDLDSELGEKNLVSLYSSNSSSLGHFDVVGGRALFLVGIFVEGCFSIGVIPKVDCVNVL